jgi:hypothetical protein
MREYAHATQIGKKLLAGDIQRVGQLRIAINEAVHAPDVLKDFGEHTVAQAHAFTADVMNKAQAQYDPHAAAARTAPAPGQTYGEGLREEGAALSRVGRGVASGLKEAVLPPGDYSNLRIPDIFSDIIHDRQLGDSPGVGLPSLGRYLTKASQVKPWEYGSSAVGQFAGRLVPAAIEAAVALKAGESMAPALSESFGGTIPEGIAGQIARGAVGGNVMNYAFNNGDIDKTIKGAPGATLAGGLGGAAAHVLPMIANPALRVAATAGEATAGGALYGQAQAAGESFDQQKRSALNMAAMGLGGALLHAPGIFKDAKVQARIDATIDAAHVRAGTPLKDFSYNHARVPIESRNRQVIPDSSPEIPNNSPVHTQPDETVRYGGQEHTIKTKTALPGKPGWYHVTSTKGNEFDVQGRKIQATAAAPITTQAEVNTHEEETAQGRGDGENAQGGHEPVSPEEKEKTDVVPAGVDVPSVQHEAIPTEPAVLLKAAQRAYRGDFNGEDAKGQPLFEAAYKAHGLHQFTETAEEFARWIACAHGG